MITKLARYAQGGIYGEMFDGPANVSIDSAFTVFEMSELKSQKDLEAVVLQIIMFLGTELMFKTDRATRVAILIDEAWDMLGSETANFLEGVVRRARKYTGALLTGTQSMLDYYENPAANVCLQNSDWTIFLAQKPEVIDLLVADGRLNAPEGIAVEGTQFLNPVKVGDEDSLFASLKMVGKSSMRIHVEAWRRKRDSEASEKVTQATFTFVAIDDDGRARPVKTEVQ